jgi:hypothetical protein
LQNENSLKILKQLNSKQKKIIKYSCFSIIGIVLLLLIIFIEAFRSREETIEIEQIIGGKLICESTYMADIQSWYYFVDYKYQKENDEIIEIGKGEYFSREWKKDEQLKKIGDWLILQTGGEFKTDKLLIGKANNSNWKTFEISPSIIEKDNFWKSKDIYTNKAGTPSEAFVKEISENGILIEYLFRVGEKYEDQETRKITYKFDEKEGVLKMSKIELKKENGS